MAKEPLNILSNLRTLVGVLVFSMGLPVMADMDVTASRQPASATGLDLTVEQRPITVITPARSSTLRVTAWVDRNDSTYQFGEEVYLYVSTNEDAYITVLDVGTSGKIHLIFPNQYQPNNLTSAGQAVMVPASNSPAVFRASGPAGNELIKVIATKQPLDLIDSRVLVSAGPYKQVTKSTAQVAKDLEVVLRQPGVEWNDFDKLIKITSNEVLVPPSTGTIIGITPPSPPPALAPSGTFAPPAVQTVAPTPGRFEIKLRAEKEAYRVGEKVRVQITPSKDCYLTVLDMGTSGNVFILFPNRYQPDNRVLANTTVVVPGENAPVDYQSTAPGGIETLVGICTTENRSIYKGKYDFKSHVFQPWGKQELVSKDLTLVLREPSSELAHTSTTFLVVP
ncbi:MAG: hypothetical protein BWK78_01610 [Thiotrichaceae bacterium IS1]|nr:MAG: hypothetical protein BWK78_01610 [Thiotrichaceae bacterium IS1]